MVSCRILRNVCFTRDVRDRLWVRDSRGDRLNAVKRRCLFFPRFHPDYIVFDAEPLIAHADNEPGSDVVKEYLDAVAVGDATGYTSYVNLAELRYTIARKYDRALSPVSGGWSVRGDPFRDATRRARPEARSPRQ